MSALFSLVCRVRHVNDSVVLSRRVEDTNVFLETSLELKVAMSPSFEQETVAIIEFFEAGVRDLSHDGCIGHILVEVRGAKHPFASI